MLVAQGLDFAIPSTGKKTGGPRMTKIALGEAKPVNQDLLSKLFDDVGGCILLHVGTMTNNLSYVKTGERPYVQKSCQPILADMETLEKTYGDIAERIRWHRALEGLTQTAYAKKIGVKRATLNNWESGDYRLSLDGALALRKTYGLSLDFMFEGNDDALPMTLRKAWRERP